MSADIACLMRQVTTAEARTTVQQLAESLASLVSLLDFGLEPELQQCPVCRQLGKRDAVRCGYCWAKLVPSVGDTITG